MAAPDNMSLLGKVAATIGEHAMLEEGSVLLVMISGGGDSTALLRLLAGEPPAQVAKLAALHVNHQLRAEDADADEAFVRDLCGTQGVPLRVVRYDVAAFAHEHGLNLEDAGRQIRYRFAEEELDALCDAQGTPREHGRIATGHTRDDRVETFLMRLAQGAGATGLTSLRPVRGRVIRPLASASRDELREYLEGMGVGWREDASNTDTSRLRARVRHELAPAFREINPRFDETLERTLSILGDEDALMAQMADAFVADFVEHRDGAIHFDRAMVSTLSIPMRRRVVRSAIDKAFPESSRIEHDHVEALVDGVEDPQFARDLPYGLRAVGEYDRMVVSRAGGGPESLAPSLLRIPGMVDLGRAGTIEAEWVETDKAEEGAGEPTTVVIDVGDLDELVVDSVREGDRMRPLGMAGTKKLSDLLIDAKVPKRVRPATPVVRDGERIVWLAGVRMSEECKVTGETRRAVQLTWAPDETREGGA